MNAIQKSNCEPSSKIIFETLIEVLRHRALNQPDQKTFTFLLDGEIEEDNITYSELDLQARAIAALLQSHVRAGERALLLYSPGLQFIAAFLGCLYAGVVAVPAYPPRNNNRSMNRIQAIASDCQAKVILTTTQTLSNVKQQFADSSELTNLCLLNTDTIVNGLAEIWEEPKINSDTLAYLQYTSGSTSTPKGVMISHKNVISNSADIALTWETGADTVLVSWLPHFHDFGLVYGIIQPLYQGFPCILMAPTSFIQKPIRWLQAISRPQATHSGAPNFAYELCTHKIPVEECKDLDLSNWCVAINGAEPIRPESLQNFAQAFQPYGFRLSTLCPGYGLAEATLKVSGVLKGEKPDFCTFDASALEKHHLIESSKNDSDTRTLVECGRILLDTKIAIVDPASLTKCQPNQVGEIWVSSSSVAHGYWNRPEESESTFRAYIANTKEGPFLRTGDLGGSNAIL
ncbi:AMP-dependent synthetase and ligase [Nostoc sp. NIES-4103]|nr:AMP-dependent synthetase and ligase [Nostoc sp. NIES-4103]